MPEHKTNAMRILDRAGIPYTSLQYEVDEDDLWTRLSQIAEDGHGGHLLVEELVDFTRELSAIVVRSPSGQAVAYPISETTQDDGMCVETITPAPGLADEDAERLQQMALPNRRVISDDPATT